MQAIKLKVPLCRGSGPGIFSPQYWALNDSDVQGVFLNMMRGHRDGESFQEGIKCDGYLDISRPQGSH